MGLFSFLEKSDESLAETTSADTSGMPPNTLNVDDSESAKTLRAAKPKTDKGAITGTGTSGVSDADRERLAQQIKSLEDLMDPKVWRATMSAPGDAMHTLTGKDYWELSTDEQDTLAKTGAATARCFMLVDPKWLALTLFSFSLLSIYGSRTMRELRERAAEKKNALPKAETKV